MILSPEINKALRELADECREDYVGLWQLARTVPGDLSFAERVEMIVFMVSQLLRMGPIKLGQFQNNRFQPWPGTEAAQLERLRKELQLLGRDPDIGEVAWLTVH